MKILKNILICFLLMILPVFAQTKIITYQEEFKVRPTISNNTIIANNDTAILYDLLINGTIGSYSNVLRLIGSNATFNGANILTDTNVVYWTNSFNDVSGLKGVAYTSSLNGTNHVNFGLTFSNAPTILLTASNGVYQVTPYVIYITQTNFAWVLMGAATLQTNNWPVYWAALTESPLVTDNLVGLPFNSFVTSSIINAVQGNVSSFVSTNLNTSTSNVTFNLPQASTQQYFLCKTNSQNFIYVVYGSSTNIIGGITVVECLPLGTNWILRW